MKILVERWKLEEFLLKKFLVPDCQLVPMSIVDSGWNIDDFGTIGKRVHELQTAFSS